MSIAPFSRSLAVPALLLLALGSGRAQTKSTPAGIDFKGLNAAQKKVAVQTLHDLDCSCKCGMKVDTCRTADPSCSYSKGLADTVLESAKKGMNESDSLAAAQASPWGHTNLPKLLNDPVSIPVTGSPATGPASASITMVEFSDFQCPYCATAVGQIANVMKAYPGQIKLIFKQYPLETHPQAAFAAAASLAADKQGKFWPMYDGLFAHRDDLSKASILALAKSLGLNMAKFEADADSTEVREAIVRDVQDGDHAGVEGTPTIFVNGQRYNGSLDLESMKPVLDAALKQPAPKAQTALLQK